MASSQEYYEKALAYYQEKNFQKAFDNFSAAAELGHLEAQNRVGECYLDGEGVNKDEALAFAWFQRVIDQEPEQANANYNIARCYEYGYGTAKDSPKAFKHFMCAAKQKHLDAMNAVGVFYLTSEGVEADENKAFEWFKKAINLDPQHGRSNNNLAYCYYGGHGTPKDEQKTFQHYLISAEQGYIKGLLNLGWCYEHGFGTATDKHKALHYYLQAANQGDTRAQYYVGKFYEYGTGTEVDRAKALQFYFQAAEKGYTEAMYRIGSLLFCGDNQTIKADAPKGLQWYLKAAENGYKPVYAVLARIYLHGNGGIPVDKRKALEFFEKAAESNLSYRSAVERLRKELTAPTPTPQKKAAKKNKPAKQKISALDKLQNLIGLASVKEEVQNAIKLHKFNIIRKAFDMEPLQITMHMVFTGNPGTGKTTVARLIGEIYNEMGLLNNSNVEEVKREDLVAGHIGQTAEKTRRCIDRALGGILFIDEAYTLNKESEKDFGAEAVETILTSMEDKRDDLMVIAAGYEKEMQHFLDINPGLKSRFSTFVHFEDYNPQELGQIFHKIVSDGNYQIDIAAEPLLTRYFERIYRTRDDQFGNARAVRNFYDEIIKQKISRRDDIASLTPEDSVFTKDDIQAAIDKFMGKFNETDAPAIEQLNAMTGLSRVKEEVCELRQMAIYQQMCQKHGLMIDEPPTMHMVFTGSPGTGKTTVARLIGKIYRELGLLPKGHVVEVKREHLVGKNIGETAPKTKTAIKQALGGVLFIDEAYTLSQGGDTDFGLEAINTLLTAMEEKRESMAVIVAGYEEEIRGFIDSNPGLKSRFTRYIHFDDYSGEELAQIFCDLAKKKNYTLEPMAMAEIKRICQEMYDNRGKNFGNAREVRNLFSAVIASLAARVSVMSDPTVLDLTQLTQMDILEAEKKQKRASQQETKPQKPRPIGFTPKD